MIKKKLKSGRNVMIKEMAIDDIDDIKDMLNVTFKDGVPNTVTGLNKQKTAWIRKGLGGGDFKDWKATHKVPDDVIKQLSDPERDELVIKIQEVQSLGEEKPSSSN